uniref:DNA primase n=1 Tax=Prevotella sp. GTC17262 TaxID=3236797 RepID=A0AB33JIU5_9BACT
MIDRQTVERIKDAANIVDVVSEFVTLRKSGSNFKGLCPFHNEKTPSFYVSPSRGTCHCFGCGKGGNSVSFIMEHEQMTYPEALRWLAKKFHIEIQERELSDEEKREQSQRESMFIVNEWAAGYFHDVLHNHVDGVAVGMQYFRSRGFRDDIIEKFQLGYDINDRHALAAAARTKGYREEFLLSTGICYRNDRGELIDRYAGRVIFPWVGVNGKIVGFGGRVLDSRTKGVNQKYVNSPESDIYHKDHELYGIYQAKKAIAKEDRVYMVEGYTDVISMHQCGIENVVANSGTALSVHQIHTLHRFTSNITLLYDGDAAGIHAALRGTDMLLAEGMNLKVLLLPDGEDPDSFARKHTATDFHDYIVKHQTDFIQFKTDLLLKNETDPQKRSEAINSIVKSISVIQNQILRDTYLHDCAQRMGINEVTLINTMNRFILEDRDEQKKEVERQRRREEGDVQMVSPTPVVSVNHPQSTKVEQMLMQLIVRYGERIIYNNVEDEEGHVHDLSLSQFVDYNLSEDGLKFNADLFNRMLAEAVEHQSEEGFKAEPYFVHHHDINISRIATDMSEDKVILSKSHKVEEDEESLRQKVLHLILDFRMDFVEQRLQDLKREIATVGNDTERMMKLLAEYKDMQEIRNALARQLGNNIIL